jgi:Tfp pilus assembly protein PilN
MRPINLIPPEERRASAPVRTGPIAYLLVGALALGVIAVTMIVLTDNKVADRKSTIAKLEQRQVAIQTRAGQLKPFIDFSQAESQRVEAIRSVADQRFDWERIMHELSLVLPSNLSLTSLTATSAGAPDSTGVVSDSSPSLQMSGCASGHETVAGFLAALKDIDGVTSVTLQSSQHGGAGAASSASSTVSSSSDCGSAVQFQVTAAFGDASAPAAASPTAAAPAATTSSSGSTTTATPASDTSGASTTGG